MALYPDPLTDILADIKTKNPGVDLTQNEYNFTAPVVIPDEPSGINTKFTITAKGPASPYAGQVDVKHKRLNLADLNILIPEDLAVSGIATTVDFALALNKAYGLNFTADDIVSSPVTLVDGTGDVTLVAKATSRGWIGQATFGILRGRMLLSDYVLVTRLNGLDYPDPYQGKPFGNAYAYWRDFSTQSAILDVIHAGETADMTNVRDALRNVTGDQWVLTGTSRFSLQGAEVLYVGEASGYPELNQKFGKAVVVQLSADCLGYSGRMFLHYNLPGPI